MKPVQVRLVGRFRLVSRISGQHTHLLYKAVHTQTEASLFLKGEEVKCSKTGGNTLSILQEGKILQTMQGGVGIPHMHWCGQEEDYNFIVLEELQTDMERLRLRCGGRLTEKCTLMLGLEAVSILQYYHFKNFIHNHFSPSHLMIGAGERCTKLFLVDFSSSIRYRDAQTLEHISDRDMEKPETRSLNLLFSSPRYHQGHTPSRRDDMASLLFVLLYLRTATLPWADLLSSTKSHAEKSKMILHLKQTLSPEEIFKGCPDLLQLYKYTITLAFDEKPRYAYYQSVFKDRMHNNGYLDDKIYDWYLLEDSDQDDDIDLDFKVVHDEHVFVQQLKQQIQSRDAIVKDLTQPIDPKKSIPSKDKECTIY